MTEMTSLEQAKAIAHRIAIDSRTLKTVEFQGTMDWGLDRTIDADRVAEIIFEALSTPPKPAPDEAIAKVREARGWAIVKEIDDSINVRSVSPTRRAAVVNWLCTERGLMALNTTSDDQIERIWRANKRGYDVREIALALLDGGKP